MKILFFVSSLNAGGAERVAVTLCNAWAEQGRHVKLVPTFGIKSDSFYPVDASVSVDWLADYVSHSPVLARLGYLGKLLALRALIKRYKPDVVVSFLTNVNVSTLLASVGIRVPILVCERTNPSVSRHRRGVLTWLRRFTYSWAAAVSVQTRQAAHYFETCFDGKLQLKILPNPLPSALADQAPAALSADRFGRYRLVALGRLVPEKQFNQLIEIFSGLATAFPDWDLWIYGEGPERSRLERQVDQKNMSQRIFLPGATTDPWGELGQASAFAMTSAVEGFPNVLLEAMGCGLPCIAYDCPSGPEELMQKGQAGVLVPLNDQQGYASGLGTLMGNPGVRRQLGQLGYRSVRTHYGVKPVLAQWDQVFRQMGVQHAR